MVNKETARLELTLTFHTPVSTFTVVYHHSFISMLTHRVLYDHIQVCVLLQFTTENVATLLFIGRILSFFDMLCATKNYTGMSKKMKIKKLSHTGVLHRDDEKKICDKKRRHS